MVYDFGGEETYLASKKVFSFYLELFSTQEEFSEILS
jgi:hypothetical protein